MAHGPGDGFFDFAETIVGGLERVTSKMPEPKSTKAKASAAPVKPAPAIAGPTTTAALIPASRFRIIEAIEDGAEIYVVTDGVSRAVCPTKAFAEQVLACLAAQGNR